ncbi:MULTISPECIES: DUF2182 domain-containing protein [Kocuria]|uniref:DUF2182 domain-containing protein n=1 Tax=Kocuria TaxID=57493 RepID=UPI0028A69FF7|nr:MULTISPECIES: DUF2182 domain-containing protein [Kocuria]MCT2360559.1 DUF2182 domain-containing protein [Kocuria marina]
MASAAPEPSLPRASRTPGTHLVVVVVVTVAALSWVVLALTHGGGHSGGHGASPEVLSRPGGVGTSGHHGAVPIPPAVVEVLIAVWAWGVMVLAMMLPPAVPLLHTVRRLTSHRADPWRLTVVSAMTFVGAWTAVGAVLVALDATTRAVAGTAWPDADPRWVTAAVVIGAGVYQFTPLKAACLRGCRSPRSFALAHWQGKRSVGAETFRLSGAYALSCIGCCWALMLICLVVGTAALSVMVALSVVMAAERLLPWGRRLVRPAGFALVAAGTAVAVLPAPVSFLL